MIRAIELGNGLERREFGYGTSLTVRYPWGLYVSAEVMCSDGKVRKVKRVSQTADTFFSVPCAVRVNGKTVAGYLTCETADGMSTETEDDPGVIKFRTFNYRKNTGELPRGTWRRDAGVK